MIMPGPNSRILLVDDSALMRSIEREALAMSSLAPLEFVEASDGAEALERLAESEFLLVVTDYQMPSVDGLALTEQIRAHASTAVRALPVVLVSSNRDADLMVRSRRAGANAFLRKPLDAEVLVSTVQRLLSATNVAPT